MVLLDSVSKKLNNFTVPLLQNTDKVNEYQAGNEKKTCQGNEKREFGKHHFEHKNLAPKSFKIVFVCGRYSLM